MIGLCYKDCTPSSYTRCEFLMTIAEFRPCQNLLGKWHRHAGTSMASSCSEPSWPEWVSLTISMWSWANICLMLALCPVVSCCLSINYGPQLQISDFLSPWRPEGLDYDLANDKVDIEQPGRFSCWGFANKVRCPSIFFGSNTEPLVLALIQGDYIVPFCILM